MVQFLSLPWEFKSNLEHIDVCCQLSKHLLTWFCTGGFLSSVSVEGGLVGGDLSRTLAELVTSSEAAALLPEPDSDFVATLLLLLLFGEEDPGLAPPRTLLLGSSAA